jgi:hypothetical protein
MRKGPHLNGGQRKLDQNSENRRKERAEGHSGNENGNIVKSLKTLVRKTL